MMVRRKRNKLLTTLYVRNVPTDLHAAVRQYAKRRKLSIRQVVLMAMRKISGIDKLKPRLRVKKELPEGYEE